MVMEDISSQNKEENQVNEETTTQHPPASLNDTGSVDGEDDDVQPQGADEWVTFDDNDEFGDFGEYTSAGYAPLSAEGNGFVELDDDDEEEETPQQEETPDYTTSGFLKNKFTPEHVDLIKECMKNVKLAYVPEWAKITREEPQWVSTIKRATAAANNGPVHHPPPEK